MESSLSTLPAELLDLILGHPSHSYLAINLWMTGDSRMTSKLLSGLTYLCLSAKSQTKNCRKPLPQILDSLPALRTFKLTSQEGSLVKSRQAWPRIISSLPKTLKALIIESRDSIFVVRLRAKLGLSNQVHYNHLQSTNEEHLALTTLALSSLNWKRSF